MSNGFTVEDLEYLRKVGGGHFPFPTHSKKERALWHSGHSCRGDIAVQMF